MLKLQGSCRCGAVRFSVETQAPCPYQLCYCSICRKTAGGGGYAINLSGVASTLAVEGADHLGLFRALLEAEDAVPRTSSAERRFCTGCGTPLWLFDPTWPELVHPFASAVDSELPKPPAKTHIMLRFKANWVEPEIAPGDLCFDEYPQQSIEDWHREHGLWLD